MRGQTARNLVLTKFGRLPTKYAAWNKGKTLLSSKGVAESQHETKQHEHMNVHGELLGNQRQPPQKKTSPGCCVCVPVCGTVLRQSVGHLPYLGRRAQVLQKDQVSCQTKAPPKKTSHKGDLAQANNAMEG